MLVQGSKLLTCGLTIRGSANGGIACVGAMSGHGRLHSLAALNVMNFVVILV